MTQTAERTNVLSPEELRHRLPGVLVFAPTPFDERTLAVDLPGFRRNLEFLAANGIQAVAVAGFVGEYSALNADEYETVLRTARDAFGPDGLIVAGVGFGTALAAQYAAAAEANGADCVMLLPPYLVEPTEDGMVAHTDTVSRATRLGLMVHSMPGFPFSARLVERLASIPGVVAYKDELGDVRSFAEIVEHVGDGLVYVNGRAEPVMAYYGLAGATVLASAIGNFDPDLALAAYAATRDGDFDRLGAVLGPRATPWYRLRERNRGYLISVSKASMNLMGLAGGAVRPPLSNLPPEVQQELVDLLTEINYLENAS
jgi:5-dehydro-4-deoxyglucarate dehydratase